ncbi:NB-ARC domain-containing protein [Kitasatospora saccharophila]|uniref:NB-ARC domain-containing protein n=1 Tax=Kitasatospora saccharophila TaxID=407973 RepID=UPI0031DCC44D
MGTIGVADGADSSAMRVDNTMSGTVHGTSMQVGSVHGGIAFHYAAAPAPGTRPDQVPRPPRRFVNRRADLARLDGLLAEGASAVLNGMPGIGKTSTLYRWAHDNQQHFPDGQLFVDFAELRSAAGADLSEALTMCLRALGVPDERIGSGTAELESTFRSESAKRRLLVVLDEVTEPSHVRSLTPKGEGSIVLATSKRRLGELALHDVELVELDVFDPDAAKELLGELCGRAALDADPAAADRLAELCGGLPIALRIVAARLQSDRLTLAQLADELADERQRLGRLTLQGTDATGVSATLSLAYRDQSEPAARLYRTLGDLPGVSFDSGVVAAAAGLDAATSAGLLADLADAHLVHRTDDGRYQLHSLVRLHAQETARETDPPETERQIVQRVTTHYLALTTLADLAVRAGRLRILKLGEVLRQPVDQVDAFVERSPFAVSATPGRDAVEWLEAERPNLMAVLRAAVRFGFDRQAWQLAEVLTVLFLHHRHLADWRESLALGADAAHRDHQPAAEARLRSMLSRPLMDLRQDDRALAELETAIELADASGHPVLPGSVRELLGRYWDRRDPERAAAVYRESLEINERAGEARGAALARYFLGRALLVAADGEGRPALGVTGDSMEVEAERQLRAVYAEFLGLVREDGTPEPDRRMAARALADLGRAQARCGAAVDARATLGRAVGELREQQAFHYEAEALESLAELTENAGERRGLLERAVEIYRESGNPRAAEVQALLAE